MNLGHFKPTFSGLISVSCVMDVGCKHVRQFSGDLGYGSYSNHFRAGLDVGPLL